MNIFGKTYSVIIRASKILSRKGLYPFLEKEFSKIKENNEVLNIGSGGDIGNLLEKYAKENNFKITTLDVDETRNPDIKGDICTHDFHDEKFDAVVLSEVLEHIRTPHLAIGNIHDLLNEGGKLIITVPFILPIHDRPYDYYRFTRFGLEYLLRDFEKVKIEERNSWAESINVLAPRMVMSGSVISRLAAPFFVLFAFIKLPFVLLFGKLLKNDFMTTGYNVTAIRLKKRT